jgi:hypothetical protein
MHFADEVALIAGAASGPGLMGRAMVRTVGRVAAGAFARPISVPAEGGDEARWPILPS